MDSTRKNNLPVMGLVLFLIITAAYITLFIFIMLKLGKFKKRGAVKFREKAERDGRKVIAYLEDSYVDRLDENNNTHIGVYRYTAPNGKKYTMKGYHCTYQMVNLPEERIIYLHPRNYRKYYLGSMQYGKRSSGFIALTFLLGFVIYWLMMRFLILPIILPELFL